jgi:hypothetical protein
VPGSLDKKEGRWWHLLLNKRWHLLPPFLSNELFFFISIFQGKYENGNRQGQGELVKADGEVSSFFLNQNLYIFYFAAVKPFSIYFD